MEDYMAEAKEEATRIRMNYKISAKGIFQSDITSEAETVETAIKNLAEATSEMEKFRIGAKFKTEE